MPPTLPRPDLPQGDADLLRTALERLARGERAPRIDALAPELRAALAAVEQAARAGGGVCGRAPDPAEPVHAAVVGIDRLAAIRSLGDAVADGIVGELARRIRARLPGCELRRTGRSTIEFAFCCAPGDAATRLDALHNDLEGRIAVDGGSFDLAVAIGYARAGPGEPLDDVLTEAAEHALARARAEHRKVVEFDEAERARRSDDLAMMRELRTALDTDALSLCYQPKLEARTGRIVGAEALLRWVHPERGPIAPDRYIRLAEQTGEIRDITERVLGRVIEDQAAMRAAGAPIAVAVNISGGLFCDDRFVAWALERIAAAPDRISLELTETAVIADPQGAIAHMRAFVDAGVRIAIDDYGAGLSSLAYLKELPAHELKIDKTFILGLTSSPRDPLIVRSTIELAHALEMKVTAEGVDNPASRALLTVMGCDMLQGFDIAPALSPAEFAAFARTHAIQAAGDSPFARSLARLAAR